MAQRPDGSYQFGDFDGFNPKFHAYQAQQRQAASVAIKPIIAPKPAPFVPQAYSAPRPYTPPAPPKPFVSAPSARVSSGRSTAPSRSYSGGSARPSYSAPPTSGLTNYRPAGGGNGFFSRAVIVVALLFGGYYYLSHHPAPTLAGAPVTHTATVQPHTQLAAEITRALHQAWILLNKTPGDLIKH